MERNTRSRWIAIALLVPVLALAGATPHPTADRSGSAEACAQVNAWTTAKTKCCKVCKKGKACGDTCIARDKVCHQPPGCACDG